ncbi:uncharacterized protein BX663DRAFT_487233 [Cokeromyces recurvatus]|uniref:uncharacterized protein n=1 Tax=Cokeromyces recurvatus TaxID=90255 RepID=UPI002220E24E|nr:uncharacterized protein BX663DRAFT_487233 [Cokeromyces recurvatus]KAI7901967.1 hypothetical protein BX663DRAFT_487233 [Cokeromyces recurvatus]
MELDSFKAFRKGSKETIVVIQRESTTVSRQVKGTKTDRFCHQGRNIPEKSGTNGGYNFLNAQHYVKTHKENNEKCLSGNKKTYYDKSTAAVMWQARDKLFSAFLDIMLAKVNVHQQLQQKMLNQSQNPPILPIMMNLLPSDRTKIIEIFENLNLDTCWKLSTGTIVEEETEEYVIDYKYEQYVPLKMIKVSNVIQQQESPVNERSTLFVKSPFLHRIQEQ